MASNAAELSSNVIATKYAYVAAATLLFWDIGLTFDEEACIPDCLCASSGMTSCLADRKGVEGQKDVRDDTLLLPQFIWDPSDTVAIVNMTACFLIILPHLTFLIRSVLLIAVFLLTAWKSYETYKIARNTRSLKLVTILFRDGFIYYIGMLRLLCHLYNIVETFWIRGTLVIICVSLINFMIWIFDPFASYLAVGTSPSQVDEIFAGNDLFQTAIEYSGHARASGCDLPGHWSNRRIHVVDNIAIVYTTV
ncbi:hypothetical protein CC1G_14791 [Coprinopsis cinerea okayama7|uniref:Uncharacterized protein n=1 Tax=Coprinopsis cinerea (strain Okayama-7 / 130 / ATCC MYA-4618 / FGSC 9003) TaxID=240176 RepID=D6RNH2_COPC7|nr:hypothetical protein CC1G_14791 [Coprinopsis cinerea okayama7\|eukprot:XP_002910813.1 hypothetical protein CC1G_14791 [Coprinopsis cinerea okayama7\